MMNSLANKKPAEKLNLCSVSTEFSSKRNSLKSMCGSLLWCFMFSFTKIYPKAFNFLKNICHTLESGY